MPRFYRSREGALSTEDSKTQLTTLGSQTAPGALLVPGGATFLRALFVSGLNSGAAAVQYGLLVRLEGPGLKRGVWTMAAGGGGTAVATGTHQRAPAIRVPINLPVTEAQEIGVFAEALGGDGDTYQVGVTLEFGTEAGPEGEAKGEITVEGDITAVDTLTRLTAQGSITAPSRIVPPDSSIIKRVVCVFASDAAADGEVSYILRLGGDAIKGGEQALVVGAESFIDVATGGDGDGEVAPLVVLEDLDIEVTPNATLDVSVEMAGVDVGTVTAVVSVIFG